MFDLIELCSTKRSYFTCKKTRVTIMWASLRSALRLKRTNSFINEREKEGGKEQKKTNVSFEKALHRGLVYASFDVLQINADFGRVVDSTSNKPT